jgi:hypothetical protein
MTTLLWILGLAGGCAALTLAMNLPRGRRLRRLARSHAGSAAFAAFRTSLPEIPEDLCESVYRGVQNLVPGKDFPVRADDNLWQTLEVDQGSLDDLIDELVANPREAADSIQPPCSSIATVADLARTVWRARAEQQRY